MRAFSTPTAFAVAAASVLSLCGSAWAGTNPQPDWKRSEDRARANIKSFSGYTLNGADHAYDVADRVIDDDGVQHIRFNRTYRGMQVIGGDLVVHNESSGNFRSASMSLNRAINVARTATISPGTATKVAFNTYGGTTNGVKPELLVYARGDIPALAYDVRIFNKQADGTPMELHEHGRRAGHVGRHQGDVCVGDEHEHKLQNGLRYQHYHQNDYEHQHQHQL